MANNKYSIETISEIREMYKDGLTITNIGNYLGIPRDTVRYYTDEAYRNRLIGKNSEGKHLVLRVPFKPMNVLILTKQCRDCGELIRDIYVRCPQCFRDFKSALL